MSHGVEHWLLVELATCAVYDDRSIQRIIVYGGASFKVQNHVPVYPAGHKVFDVLDKKMLIFFIQLLLMQRLNVDCYKLQSPLKRPTLDRMFASTSQRNDDGLRASYNISLLIAKSGKPHTVGEKLILPAVEEVLKTVLHKPASDIIKRIPLSNNTVERRIDEMSSGIESLLCNYLQTTHFSIQLDESTLPDNAALLLAYVRFIMNQEIYEELLFARTLITDTKGYVYMWFNN
ncbi:unnamed protein product [Acanthoscelides obtectus]|uniref:Zinc finger BED domain-containing protein 5 n=1 Tax=Acanthoscelides obtectus TaxID=200917 RepID=A0A9P0MLY1_ACAOB|nr:unnamed protein product [Acanthoscelides obtectus]CAK1640423.1 SCAN domain-containing protein 3 [Acanthoscelides obtectus]